MKNKILPLILLIIFCVLISIVVSLSIYSTKLNGVIEKQNVTLNNYKKLDSLVNEGNSNLVTSINNFFKDIPTYKDGKRVSPVEFIDYHDKMLDSLKDLKWKLDFIKRSYGIYVVQKSEDKQKTITINGAERIDSALALLPNFGNRIIDRKGDTWSIDLAGKELKDLRSNYKKLEKKRSDDIEYYRSILKQMSKKGLVKIDTLKEGYQYIF